MTLTEEQIAEIRARAEAATPGPWILYDVAFKKPDLDFIKHSRYDIPDLLSALEAANKRADEAEALAERLKNEAQLHAQEARTANATIAEIYREVSGGKGEPGNWNGAEPIRRELTALRARVAELEVALRTIARHPIENVCMGRPDLGIPGYASCQDVARAALKGASHEQG